MGNETIKKENKKYSGNILQDEEEKYERKSSHLKVHYATFFYRSVNKQRDRALDARNCLQELT